MPFETMLLLAALAFIVLALIGFISVLRFLYYLVGGRDPEPNELSTTRKVIDELHARHHISSDAYDEIIDAIYGRKSRSRRRATTSAGGESTGLAERITQRSKDRPAPPAPSLHPLDAIVIQPDFEPVDESQVTPTVAPPILPPAATEQTSVAPTEKSRAPRPIRRAGPSTQPSTQPRLRDEAPTPPRRSWSEIFALFMQEKNIRWGELASGILIVGSAIGLVLSLRYQLREAIPYFPALLFLLITAAIVAAGVYTLKRWRLQTTSRGILLIGLFLIPLNVLIGCWLAADERRVWTPHDPIYWIAVAVELISLSFLAWLAAKNLFRVRYEGLVVAVMACAAYTLFINRISDPSSSALRTAGWMLPLGLFACVGMLRIAPRMNVRGWNARGMRRLLASAGVSLFAAAVGLSLFFIKWTELTIAIALAPFLSVVGIAICWLGGLALLRPRRLSPKWGTVALAMVVLGLILTGGSVIVAQIHPALGLATALLAALLWIIHAQTTRVAWPVIPGIICAAIAVVTGVDISSRVWTGESIAWDGFTTVAQILQKLISGRTALSLMAASVAMGFTAIGLARRWGTSGAELRYRALTTTFGVFAAGVVLSVAASLSHPTQLFDVWVATVLLASLAAMLLNLVVRPPRSLESVAGLPAMAAVAVLAALIHALWWNSTVREWITAGFGQTSLVPFVATAFSLTTALTGLVAARFRKSSDRAFAKLETIRTMTGSAIAGSLVTWFAMIALIPNENGLASILGLVLTGVWILIALTNRDAWYSCGFQLSLAVAALVFIAEFGRKLGWYGDWSQLRFVLCVLAALAVWCLPWPWLFRATRTTRLGVLFDTSRIRPEASVSALIVIVIGAAIAMGLIPRVLAEVASHVDASGFHWFDLTSNFWLVSGVLGLSFLTVVKWGLERVRITAVALLCALWFFVFALMAVKFEDSLSAGSALRWSVAIGGFVLSLLWGMRKRLAWAWTATAKWLGFDLDLKLSESERLAAIKGSLATAVLVVLVITGMVTAPFMVYGGKGVAGPAPASMFGRLPKDISHGVPIALLVASCLSYAISQRRAWLAMIGSGVFQVCVVGALILLAISQNPAIASVRFIQIMQFVSIGMSIYGVMWFWLREKIEQGLPPRDWSYLQLHTVVNVGLMFGLCTIILSTFWFEGRIAGAWLRAVGGPAGIAAIVVLLPVTIAVLPAAIERWRLWLIGIFGSMVVAIVALEVDRTLSWALPLIGCGFTALFVAQVLSVSMRGLAVGHRDPVRSTFSLTPLVRLEYWPLALVGGTAIAFCSRMLGTHFWIGFAAISVVLLTTLLFSLRYWSSLGVFSSYAIAAYLTQCLAWHYNATNPATAWSWAERIELIVLSAIAIALVTVIFMLLRARRIQRMPPRRFTGVPNAVGFAASLWVTLLVPQVYLLENLSRINTGLLPLSRFRLLSILGVVLLLTVQLWNVRSRWLVLIAWFSSGTAVALAVVYSVQTPVRETLLLALAVTLAFWCFAWRKRRRVVDVLKSIGMARPARQGRELAAWIPRLAWVFSVPIFVLSTLSIFFEWGMLVRLLTALTPAGLALGFWCLATKHGPAESFPLVVALGRSRLRFVSARGSIAARQMTTAILFTLAAVYLMWVDLTPGPQAYRLWSIRALTILAAGMVLFAILIPRWARRGDAWLATLRRMTTLLTLVNAGILSLLVIDAGSIVAEGSRFTLPWRESLGVVVATVAIVASLIAIAIRPIHDPLSFSIPLRKALVYSAQFIGVLGIVYCVLTIPWLFDLGLREYWPYILMGVAFGGILLSKLLEKRELTVLAQPLLNTAMMIPLAGTAGALLTTTETDAALVMLLAGLVYLALSFIQRSTAAGMLALALGNGALFHFYSRIPQFRFVDHPQLWLIPPAVSALIAAQIQRHRLKPLELAGIRYAALGMIYVSSTSEIFIRGIGEQLWPPIILATLALAGMALGIVIQARAFLFVGLLFLFMAVAAMVAHAHRQFEHVWPWWAFGICTGIGILVLFGLFEKRRNDFRRVASHLQQWDL